MHRNEEYERVAYEKKCGKCGNFMTILLFRWVYEYSIDFYFRIFSSSLLKHSFLSEARKWSTTSVKWVLCMTNDTCAPHSFDPICLRRLSSWAEAQVWRPFKIDSDAIFCSHRLRLWLRLCTSQVILLSYIFYRHLLVRQHARCLLFSDERCNLSRFFMRSYVIYCLHGMRLH